MMTDTMNIVEQKPDAVNEVEKKLMPEMTLEHREQMFAKDYLSIKDIQMLLKLDYDAAAALIRQIRRKCDRLNIQGKIHVQDYIDYFKLDIARYIATGKGEGHVHIDG